MATPIDESNRYVTLINTFTVDPKRQQELVDLLNEATEKTMRHQPGFISASIHASFDGKRVVNYAQWASEKDFKNMSANPQAAKHMKQAAALAKFDPNLYRVVKVHRAT
jgi:quinol monooxygenase YgiN